MPDQVKVNFLLYSVAEILPKVKITDDEVKQYFDDNKAQFEGSLSASHNYFQRWAKCAEKYSPPPGPADTETEQF